MSPDAGGVAREHERPAPIGAAMQAKHGAPPRDAADQLACGHGGTVGGARLRAGFPPRGSNTPIVLRPGALHAKCVPVLTSSPLLQQDEAGDGKTPIAPDLRLLSPSMGRGGQQEAVPASGPRFESAENLRGAKLVESVLIGRSALENWARLRGGRDELASARAELLTEIRKHGRLSDAPEWMTSVPQGIEAWIALPGELWLGLEAGTAPGFRWLARNCFAPKRVRRLAPPPRPLRRARLEGEALERALRLRGDELVQAVSLSRHARERYGERVGAASPKDAEAQLRAAIRSTGRVVARIPGWADAAGCGGAALLVGSGAEAIALPLLPCTTDQDRELVASTCIPRAWSEETLDTLSGRDLVAAIHVSSRLAARWARERGLEPEEARRELERAIAEGGRAERSEAGALCRCNGLVLRLRASGHEGVVESGKPWVATGLAA